MRKLLIIGVGPGNPEQVTVQAIQALNTVDVFFTLDKGDEKGELNGLRRQICSTYIKGRSYRMVTAPDAERDRAPASYTPAVQDWHKRRVEIVERLIAEHLKDGECGAFLVWGDPSLYDSTLRIVEQVLARGAVTFSYEVIPGVSSVQALAAAHKIALNRIGGSLVVTTGRNLREGLPAGFDDILVMLDGNSAFNALPESDIDIYWGAYVGTADELLVAGDLRTAALDIERLRNAARARKGWIMDAYLLRRRGRR